MESPTAGLKLDRLDPERWRRIAALAEQAFELGPAEVPALLDRECGADPTLRAEVEALIAADRGAGPSFLEAPVTLDAAMLDASGEGAGANVSPSEMEGRRVGAWRLLRELGRGGMGAVYLAERADGAYEQQVALKLIKRGLDTDEILQRFLRERRILARLEHPHIARLLDGGVTDDGLPWFAMEHVEGRAITAWCEERHARLAERLRLFRAACQAVQHAHRSLVIHRDLKPSNIFVTAAGEVKLLDFGIARLLADEGAGDTTLTRGGDRLLTPHYAAPEQIRGEDATTATDLYSLGVVLYELLAGSRPYGRGARTVEEAERAVLDEEPAPPSEVRREWRQDLRGDLDHIALMALRKESRQRYPSVDALLDDLERFHEGLPVRATPPSTAYQLAKFVRRHRAAVVAGGIVALTVVAGAIVALWQVAAAVLLVASLVGGLAAAIWQARAARREAAKADEVKRFLVSVFEVSDPSQARGQSVTARELLDRGAQRIESELRGQPVLRVEIMGVLGDLYVKLGLADPGLRLVGQELEMLEASTRRAPRALAAARRRHGNLLILKGEWKAAEAPLREAARLHAASLGESSAEYAEDLDQLATVLRFQAQLAEAERCARQSLEIRRRVFGNQHPLVATSLNNIAVLAREAGRLDESEALYGESLRIRRVTLPREHPDVCSTLNNLAVLLRQMGRYEASEQVAREALALHVQLYGEQHAATVSVLNTLGALMLNTGRPKEAEPLFRRIMDYWRSHEGGGHPNAVATLNNIATALRDQGEFAAAEPLQREAVEHWRSQFGNRHPFYAYGLVNLAAVVRELGRLEEARDLLAESLEIRRSLHGDDHHEVATVFFHQADLASRQGDLEAAELLYRQSLAMREKHLGVAHPVTATCRAGLAAVLIRRGLAAQAEPMAREAVGVLRGALPEAHPDRVAAEATWAALAGMQERPRG